MATYVGYETRTFSSPQWIMNNIFKTYKINTVKVKNVDRFSDFELRIYGMCILTSVKFYQQFELVTSTIVRLTISNNKRINNNNTYFELHKNQTFINWKFVILHFNCIECIRLLFSTCSYLILWFLSFDSIEFSCSLVVCTACSFVLNAYIAYVCASSIPHGISVFCFVNLHCN